MKKLYDCSYFLLTYLFLCVSDYCFAGNHRTDSLKQVLSSVQADTSRIDLLYKLALTVKPYRGNTYQEELCELAERKNIPEGKLRCLVLQGIAARDAGEYQSALAYVSEALEMAQHDKYSEALCMIHTGEIYRRLDDYQNALQYYMKALAIAEKKKATDLVSEALSGIGNTHRHLQDYTQALRYLNRMLQIEQQTGNQANVAIALTSIGRIHFHRGSDDKALECFEKSLEIERRSGNQKGIAIGLNTLAMVYNRQRRSSEALTCLIEALEIDLQLGDKRYLTDTYLNLGITYSELGNAVKSIEYLHQALKEAEQIHAKSKSQQIYERLSKIYKQLRQYDKALAAYEKAMVYKDSLLNEEKNKAIARLQTVFEAEKRDKQIKQLESKRQVQDKEISYQRMTTFSLAGGLICILLLLGVLYRNNYHKGRANQILAIQNERIQHQNNILRKHEEEIQAQNRQLQQKQMEILSKNDVLVKQNREIEIQRDNIEKHHVELEEKDRHITASLCYAKRIQTAMLPTSGYIATALPQHFIFFKPRDIVSGDFYWFSNRGDKAILAAVDCTGHGVPGAFMSMIGDSLLSQIVNEKNITRPDLILSEMHKGVRRALKQTETENRDGMDIALCVIDQVNQTMEYAGANNPLYLFQQQPGQEWAFTEIKANKTPIGGVQQQEDQQFTVHTIDISVPTRFYLFSDGYQDQIGGSGEFQGRRFMSRRFRELLASVHHLPMAEQKQTLQTTIENWVGSQQKPIDDMLVIGVSLPGKSMA